MKIRRREKKRGSTKFKSERGKKLESDSENICQISKKSLEKKFDLLIETRRYNQSMYCKSRNENWNQNETGQQRKESKRCYNCGAFQQLSIRCPHLNRGTRCFSCGDFGHLSTSCFRKQK